MQSERDEMEYYGYTQRWVILCKNCKNHGTCRYEQHLGLDGYCSKAERKDVLLEADLTSEQIAYLKGYADGKAESIKHGRWKHHQYGNTAGYYECDNCGKINSYKSNYCPKCGAKMDEVEE